MPTTGPIKQKAAKVYLPESEYNELAGRLRADGSDVSKWFRNQVRKFLYESRAREGRKRGTP